MARWLSTLVKKTPEKPIEYCRINALYDISHSMVYAYSPFSHDGITVDLSHASSLRDVTVFFPEAILAEYENVPGSPNHDTMELFEPYIKGWVCITDTEAGKAPSEASLQKWSKLDLDEKTCYVLDSALVLHETLLKDVQPDEDLTRRADRVVRV